MLTTSDDNEKDSFKNDNPFIDEDKAMKDIRDEDKIIEDADNMGNNNDDDHNNSRILITQNDGLKFQLIFKKLCKETEIGNEKVKKLATIIITDVKITIEQVIAVNIKLLVIIACHKDKVNHLKDTVKTMDKNTVKLLKKEI
ncbi:hypothetical protein FQN50_006995 [Emmonsiellopsis sp. PD_5]|nr:hypothetical protein FQN50_006995 [Emmonsiellopsis sp. PD_5]